jgi:hypothetical protein
MKTATKKAKPRLTLEAGTAPDRVTLLRLSASRTPEVMSGCSVTEIGEERFYGANSDLDFIRGSRAKDADNRRELWLGKAAEHDARAKKARGVHIKRQREDADWCRRYAEEPREYNGVLPTVAMEGDGDGCMVTPYELRGGPSANYANTFEFSIYDAAGREIVSCRVTAPDEAVAVTMQPLREIATFLQYAARNGLALVSG